MERHSFSKAGADTISTRNDHWDQLRGQRIACSPDNGNALPLEHTPALAPAETTNSHFGKTGGTGPLLQKHRQLIQLFADKVTGLVEIDG